MRQILYTILTLFVLTGTAASWQAAGQVREDRMYRIVSPSGLAIDNRLNPDNLGNLFLSPVDRKDKGQLWRLVKYADAYVIYSPFTNKSFDVVNAGGEDTPLGTWDFSRANVNQHFVVTFNADGTIAINHQNSGRGLALTGEDRDGEKVFLMKQGEPSLKWTLVPAKDKLPPENLRGKAEWENEQWFETMQDIWMNYPLAVTMGNHDRSQYNNNNNFYWHFNNDTTFNQTSKVPLTMPGTVFSFVHGDALFLMLSFEDYSKEGLLDELEKWIRNEVAEHPNVKWRFASFHKNMFTGSRSHQSDKDGKIIREKFLPIFNELHIHFALQGHDHIYEVIGPVTNDKTLVDGAVEKVETVEPSGVRENMTGKSGGVFNVNKGTLYFLNNSAGVKKYEPRSEDDMIDAFEDHNVENYWGLFSGKFGQTGEPTFSHITVKSDSIFVDTYTVNTAANAELFDSFIIINKESGADNVQSDSETNRIKIYFNKNTEQIVVEGIDAEQVDVFSANGAIVNSTSEEAVNTSGLTNGLYIVKAKKGNDNYFGKVMVE